MSIGGIFKRIFGTSHERMMRKLYPIVANINDLESQVSALSDEDLKAQTPKFKEMLDNGASLDDILPEAFATVREASKRVLNMRHYDVQLIGGIVLHRGMISEMKTGEGKTLVATSPMYLNALAGKGAHLVTVNDYLAGRDADWMGQIYKFLGLSVGKILTDMDNEERRKSYDCDITYGTNNEFGFDYLRDNMKYQLSDYVQRGHYYAIVDEVDSILIDEARTPLIISGQMEQDLNLYKEINKLVPFLKRDEDYAVDEKAQSVSLNESGIEKLEKHLNIDNIYDPKYIEYLHHVNKALQAHTLYKLDQNYVIENGKIVIIDDFTGRMMHGRRWSDGLHQAIEAKEGVEIQAESQTLATITFQNYFRMYEKLAGMTGTADTEAEEFKKIYKLDVVCIPTAKKIIRKDYQDVIYFNEKAKIAAIAEQIRQCHEKGQPILVGTVSVEKSEVFSKAISKLGIEHNVLNAKNHKREAEIIAQAGRKGAVTIATNMAGRGTDILLGGNPEFLARQEVGSEDAPGYQEALEKYRKQCAAEKAEVTAAGGLFILGTERHESRRIDNQLRGRAGRQGDPGASRFFLSLDDDLLRIFGGEELKNRMAMFGMDKQADVPIEAGIVSRSIETAQKRVEGRNFDIRKNLLEYDDVMNSQRKSVYELRNSILKGDSLEEEVLDAFEAIVYSLADEFMPAELAYEDWNMDGILRQLDSILGYRLNIDVSGIGRGDRDARIKLIWDEVEKHYHKQVGQFDKIVAAFKKNMGNDSPYKGQTGKDLLMELAQNYYLREIDHFWRAHLTTMTSLRESISLRGYAQKDPKQEYKREAYTLFEKMMRNIKMRMMTQVCRVQAEVPDFSRMNAAERNSAKNAPVSREQNQTPVEPDKKQVEELRSMAAQNRQAKPQERKPSPSMAELMAMAREQQAKKAESSQRKLSMADLMPASIAQAAGIKKEPEKPKKAMSMADLMPVSIMNAVADQRKQAERMRAEMERAAEEPEEEEISEPDQEISEPDQIEEPEQMVFDDPCVISAGESDDAEPADSENEDSAGSSEQPDTDDLFNRLLSHDDEDKPLRSESLDDLFGGNSLDLSALSDGSDLSSGDSNELASSSGLSLNNDLMSGFDDFGSENEKKDDNDPFGDLFSGLKL
ncbi:MAG: preprotein translocase subunit SecA [Proteobacteria bacterium]|nr:preprotein translocase subunit SecA [Pseudomonadota bacterium]